MFQCFMREYEETVFRNGKLDVIEGKNKEQNKKQRRDVFEASLFYRYEKIIPLEKMLQREYYNLYHKAGVEWLLYRCNFEILKSFGRRKIMVRNLKIDLEYIKVNME